MSEVSRYLPVPQGTPLAALAAQLNNEEGSSTDGTVVADDSGSEHATSQDSGSEGGSASGSETDILVRGYTRRNGTSVAAHSRAMPSSKPASSDDRMTILDLHFEDDSADDEDYIPAQQVVSPSRRVINVVDVRQHGGRWRIESDYGRYRTVHYSPAQLLTRLLEGDGLERKRQFLTENAEDLITLLGVHEVANLLRTEDAAARNPATRPRPAGGRDAEGNDGPRSRCNVRRVATVNGNTIDVAEFVDLLMQQSATDRAAAEAEATAAGARVAESERDADDAEPEAERDPAVRSYQEAADYYAAAAGMEREGSPAYQEAADYYRGLSRMERARSWEYQNAANNYAEAAGMEGTESWGQKRQRLA